MSQRQAESRREFLKTSLGTAAAIAGATAGVLGIASPLEALAAEAASPPKPTSETLVAQLYSSLKDEQRKAICFPFDHKLRSEVDNNWFIVKDKRVKNFFTGEQQALIKEIFLSIHSPEYADQVLAQVEHDNKDIGGFGACSVAMFGEPASTGSAQGNKAGEKFEFVLTGRHTTRRCDGNSVDGAAFGGPIFYGHAAGSFNEKADHAGNVYWFQGKRANEVFAALDGRQRKLALVDDVPPGERGAETVELPNKRDDLQGIPVGELSADQKGLVRKVLADLLAPFRKADADEALKLIEAGGFDQLRMAFFSKMDIGDDKVWDVWQIQGENMTWYFRGAPHVHTWVNIREPRKA